MRNLLPDNQMSELSILIVGSAGEGLQTIGAALSIALASCGRPVFSWQEFESRIRGGYSSYALRVSDLHPFAPTFEADFLLALNDKALARYGGRLKAGGMAISQGEGNSNGLEPRIPFAKIAEREFGKTLYANSLALGFLGALAEIPREPLEKALAAVFGGKGEAVVSANLKAARRGHELGLEKAGAGAREELPCEPKGGWLLTGQEALAAGAAAAGLKFISAYPMSPSTSIITMLAELQDELGIFVVQAEDEIAAANMVIGASFAGARAMTATSGGGFALMVESLSLAGMTETPMVVVLAQRPGPATGLPTRTAQGDLAFALNAGHGEFPKAVLAPGDAEEAFAMAGRAFELAEEYQLPVVILTDQYLADSKFKITTLPLTPGASNSSAYRLADPAQVETPYRRYRLTEDFISPRLYPGQSPHLVRADSDEHDESGDITEELASTVGLMVEKRAGKTRALRKAMRPPRREGSENPEVTLVGWGSTLHALREAVSLINAAGKRAALLHFTELWPLPEFKVPACGRTVCVEGNATGQFERLLSAEAGIVFDGRVRRTDGLPIDARFILGKMGESP